MSKYDQLKDLQGQLTRWKDSLVKHAQHRRIFLAPSTPDMLLCSGVPEEVMLELTDICSCAVQETLRIVNLRLDLVTAKVDAVEELLSD